VLVRGGIISLRRRTDHYRALSIVTIVSVTGSAFLIGVIFPKEAVTIESTLATYEAKITSSLKEDLTAGKTLRLASFGTASCEPEVEGQEARSAGHR
jgi:hypothetical protein